MRADATGPWAGLECAAAGASAIATARMRANGPPPSVRRRATGVVPERVAELAGRIAFLEFVERPVMPTRWRSLRQGLVAIMSAMEPDGRRVLTTPASDTPSA